MRTLGIKLSCLFDYLIKLLKMNLDYILIINIINFHTFLLVLRQKQYPLLLLMLIR